MEQGMDLELARRIVEQAQDAIVFADPEGVIRLWNPGAEALFGYPAGEAVGQSLDLVIPERFRGAHWAGYQRAMDSGQGKYGRRPLPTRSVRRDGTDFYLEMSLAILKDDSGRALGALAVAHDITERRAEERALRSAWRSWSRARARPDPEAAGRRRVGILTPGGYP